MAHLQAIQYNYRSSLKLVVSNMQCCTVQLGGLVSYKSATVSCIAIKLHTVQFKDLQYTSICSTKLKTKVPWCGVESSIISVP